MLKSVSVENWKSIGSATQHIDALTVLIGTNASGKSNLLDAFSFLGRIASGMLLTSALQGDGVLPQLRGGLEWASRHPGDSFTIRALIGIDDMQDLDYEVSCRIVRNRCELQSEQLQRSRYRPDKRGERGTMRAKVALFSTQPADPESPTVSTRVYNGKGGTVRQMSRATSILFQLFGQKTLSETQDGIESVLDALRGIFILDPIPSHMRAFSPLSDRLSPDAGNIAGVLAALPPTSKIQVESTLTHYASSLPERDIIQVHAETVGMFHADAMLYCEEGYGAGTLATTIDARGMSDGTLRFLAILTALLTRPKGSLLIVEEVDNGLHPSRSDLLLKMLGTVGGERGVDVMVTTHNPALLDAMGSTMVPFITVAHRDPADGTTKLTLLEDVAALPKVLAEGPVGRVSSRGLIEKALKEQVAEPA